MDAALEPILAGAAGVPLWEVGWAHGVGRDALRTHLGEPFYVESDSLVTFGGEEDWWAFRTQNGTVLAVCLRVPYEDAVVCASDLASIGQAAELIAPWTVEFFAEPRIR